MQRRQKRLVVSIVVVILAVALSACNRVELYGNLSEDDANELLVLLSENDISTQKQKDVRQNEVFYSILVSSDDVVKARSLLVKHNLPRRRRLGLSGVYKEKGLIPTPDEQKARFLLALKGELINSLSKIPDVVDADVVLNVPTVDEFADAELKKQKRPTASVVLKVKPEAVANRTVTEAKVQQFVANGVEGLNPRDVTVIISYLASKGRTVRPGDVVSLPPGAPGVSNLPSTPPAELSQTLIGLSLDEPSKARLKIYLLIFFVVLLLLSAVLILAIVQGSRMRRELSDLKHGGEQHAVEGEVLNEGPPQLGAPPSGETSGMHEEMEEGEFADDLGDDEELR